jgi:hypothetical protein
MKSKITIIVQLVHRPLPGLLVAKKPKQEKQTSGTRNPRKTWTELQL